MKQLEVRQRLVKYLAYLLFIVLLGAGLLHTVLAHAVENKINSPAWAAPSVMALKRVGPVADIQHEPNFLSNLDCSLVDYRLVAGGATQTGCFTPTAFGLLDSDSDTVIFNGTDEGLPLLPYSAHQVLVPWPQSLDLVVLDAANTGGSYVSLYKNPLAALRDQRNSLLQLTSKQLTAPPDLPLKGLDGKQLLVNAQTMAFSDGGSWLAAETLGGSFVRINLATLDETAFAPAFGSQGSPVLLKSQVAISSDGRYVAINNDDASSLKVYDLAACDGAANGLESQGCAAHDYLPFVTQKISGLRSVRHLRFVNDGLLSFETQTGDASSSGIYELAPQASITSLFDYLALGDSYTSGEGAFDYLAGTDTENDMCHLSANSYPLLLTHDLFSAVGGHSVACSGAVINDVGSTSQNYRGQVRGIATLGQLQQSQAALLDSIMANYQPGYVAQQRFVRQYQPAITTVSVGGDDVGFGDIVQNCVVPHLSPHISDSTCYNTYEDRLELTQLIDRTVPRWTALYKELLGEAPGTRVYAIGYPEVVADTGNCALNAHLGKSEMEFAEELIDYLNSSIQQAAANAGVTYVDISQALAGHRLCETDSYNVALNGLTAGTDGSVLGIRIFGKESYHPNALGHALIEQAILKQTHNLASVAAAPVASGGKDILAAPKTGRKVNNVVPDSGLATRIVPVGKSVAVQASGTRDGLKAKIVYTVKLDGSGGIVLGTATSDDTGDVSTSVTLPGNTAPGGHTIDITGENEAGEPVDATQPVYVPSSDNDADGDGIPDTLDTCPGATNSGQDSDRDGIDDTCDGFIGPPPAPAPGSSNGPIAGPGNGQTVVNGPLSGVTASLATLSSATVTGSNVSSGQAVNNTGGAAHSPSSVTAKPAIKTPAKLSGSLQPGTEQASTKRPFTGLDIINWLPWAILLVTAWLLILLGLGIRRFMDRPGRTEYKAG